MAITQKSIKLLWSAAGGRCAFPNCWERLTFHEAEGQAPFTLGQMAHICGDQLGSNRHNPAQSPAERDDYGNLILLCPTHHTLIDRPENEAVYPVELLHKFKAEHEKKVLALLNPNPAPNRNDIAAQILILLDQNRLSWEQYGPLSERARREPHNEAAHAVWTSERLSTIVPNNRKIAEILNEHRGKFDLQSQSTINKFLIHARSYEIWVRDDISYAAVVRFPLEFDTLIRENVNAGAQQ